MISKGLTEQQALIEYRARILLRILYDVKHLIEHAFADEKNSCLKTAIEISDGDNEISESLFRSMAGVYAIEDESFMLDLFDKMMIVMVDSYCESTLKQMVKNQKKSKKVTEIEKQLSLIVHKTNVEEFLKKHWPSFHDFHIERNLIIHENKTGTRNCHDTNGYIAENIECVRKLLRAVDAEIAKNDGTNVRNE